MRVGDKILHKGRKDLGTGELVHIYPDGTCNAVFPGSKFSGIPLTVLVRAEEVRQEEVNADSGFEVFQTRVAGVSFNNKDGSSRQELLKEMKHDDPVLLEREPDNPYDSNAIRVVAQKGCIGYIPRDLAKIIVQSGCLLQGGRVESVRINDFGYYSCRINVCYRSEMSNELKAHGV